MRCVFGLYYIAFHSPFQQYLPLRQKPGENDRTSTPTQKFGTHRYACVLICLIKFIKVHKRLILMWLLWNKLQCYEVEHHINRNGGQYDETGIGNRAALQRVQREGLVSIVDALQTGVRGTRKIKSRNLSLTKSLKTPLEVRNF